MTGNYRKIDQLRREAIVEMQKVAYALVDEYVGEAEHQDGIEYWLNFTTSNEDPELPLDVRAVQEDFGTYLANRVYEFGIATEHFKNANINNKPYPAEARPTHRLGYRRCTRCGSIELLGEAFQLTRVTDRSFVLTMTKYLPYPILISQEDPSLCEQCFSEYQVGPNRFLS